MPVTRQQPNDAAVGAHERQPAVGARDDELVVGHPAVAAAHTAVRGDDQRGPAPVDGRDDEVAAPVVGVDPRELRARRRPLGISHGT